MKMVRKVATLDELFAIRDKLAIVCRKVGEGVCEYVDHNITDASIAHDIGCPLAAVARVRRDQYGHLRVNATAGRGQAITELSARSDKHDQQFVDAARRIAILEQVVPLMLDHFIKLCIKLQTERVSDVKYLGDGLGVYRNGALAPPLETRR